MRHLPTKAILAAVTLGSAACGDASRTTSQLPTVPTQPPVNQPPVVQPPVSQPPVLTAGTLGYARREIPVGRRIGIGGPIHIGYDEDWGPFAYVVRDTDVAEWRSLGPSWGTVEGRKPGVTELTVRGIRMQATISITVLDTTSAPSPVVVDDFFLIEVQEGDQFEYVPRLLLRDTSTIGASALIGLWFELPDRGATERCAMYRPILGSSTQVLRDSYSISEFPLEGRPRFSGDRPVLAHLTLRVPGPYAKEMSVAARIVAGPHPPEVPAVNDDLMSCE